MPLYEPIVGGLKTLSKWAIENAPKKAQDLRKMFEESLVGQQIAHGTEPANIESIQKQGLLGTPYFMVGSPYGLPAGDSTAHFSMRPTKSDIQAIYPDPETLSENDPDAWKYLVKKLKAEHPDISNEYLQYYMQGLPEYQNSMYKALDTTDYLQNPSGLAVLSTKPILPSKLKLTMDEY